MGASTAIESGGTWTTISHTYKKNYLVRVTFNGVVLSIERMEVIYSKNSKFGAYVDPDEIEPGTNGQVLTTNGSTVAWQAPSGGLPDQTGNSGKVLTTNGSTTSWIAVAGTGTVTNIATTGPITGGPITSTGTIGITQSGVETDGYLSSTDWNTFNNKQSAITIGSPANGLSLSSNTLSLGTASGSTTGALTSADWTTFNNKLTLPALTNGSVIFSNGTTLAQDNTNFFWDDANNRLGIGTNTPATALDVKGTLTLDGATSGYVAIKSPTTVATSYTVTLPDAQGASGTWLKNDGSGNLTWEAVTSSGFGANQSLSNLTSPTSINQSLIPSTGSTYDLGSATLPWRNIYGNLITVGAFNLTGRMQFSYFQYDGSATAVTIPNNVSVYCFNGTQTADVTFPTVTSADNGIVMFIYNYSTKALNNCPDQGSTTRNLVSSKGGTWMVINGEWVCIGVS